VSSLFGGLSGLSAVAFLSPWWLLILGALPILYWLLRVTPPAPRRALFPAIRLLFELKPKEETPAKTPWWLLLLRLVVAMLLIFALAHPLLNPQDRIPGAGPMVLVIDDGWASARNWTARKDVAFELVDRAAREDRNVIVLRTAPSMEGDAPRPSRLMRANEARTYVGAVEPQSWPVDRNAARESLADLSFPTQSAVYYIADGMADDALNPLLERLQRLGGVDVIDDSPDRLARLLMPPVSDGNGLAITAQRIATNGSEQAFVRGTAEDGRLLARETLQWNDGDKLATARLALPTELRNRLARFEIENEASAGATVLLDERWRRRPVGIVAGGTVETQQPLLADVYYLERAMSPFSEVRTGVVSNLLRRELAVVILADVGNVSEADRGQLEEWMKKGGVVVRFAGPRMADSNDDFTPVPLRAGGGRSFGGAMSWAQPVGVSQFDNNSPFAGLNVPEDVKVSRQVLAEPSLDLASKSWARLSDGTPLVTADRRGDGWLVLMHTTASPEWSSLPMSGLFVEMLQRLVALSQGVAGDMGDATLPPQSSLDGFGRLQSPPPAAAPVPARAVSTTPIGPRHPPGYYGSEFGRVAVNVSASVQPPRAIGSLPPGVAKRVLVAADEVDFKPWLLAIALGLALLDLLVSLAYRGHLRRAPLRTRAAAWLPAAALGASLSLLLAGSALAQVPRPGQPAPPPAAAPRAGEIDEQTALLSTLTTRLGYVQTGRRDVDEASRAGLLGLGTVLQKRTAVDAGVPAETDVEQDELSFMPLLYWPVLPETPRPSPEAIVKLNAFIHDGGMLVFDTRDSDSNGPAALRLRDILRQLDLAALTPVPAGHVLTKSFYLLSEFPGRWVGSTVWVEQGDERVNDGVSSVVIGANDWASAWATDQTGRPMFAAVPGGEAQRETAYRFGVNLVMYALAGNYKADQVHVDAILERLRR
jgi:hypothetical protein